MSKYKLVPFAFIVLFACQDADPERILGPDQAVENTAEDGQAFATDLAMTNFMILPAAALGVSTTDFRGRCSAPAVWISVFWIEGAIPQVGEVWGSASHCAYKEDPDDPLELPTYEDGQAWLRAPNGDNLYLEYGNGTTSPVEGGLLAFRDEWQFTGGTGRFRNVTGSGIDYGEYDPADVMDPDPETRFPYQMTGTLDYDAVDGGRAANFRGTFRFSMTFPYLAAGTPAEDPCAQEHPGQWTTVMEGEGTATHLGPFTTHAEFCYNWQAREGDPRIHHGVTASGDTFQWVCDQMEAELPLAFFVPGLERVYAMRTHEVLTGLSGRLEGWGVEINGAGAVVPAWQSMGGVVLPAYPWWAELEMAGAWVRQ